jgi:hypothetical protein
MDSRKHAGDGANKISWLRLVSLTSEVTKFSNYFVELSLDPPYADDQSTREKPPTGETEV